MTANLTKYHLTFAALVALASLNRETGAYLVLAYALTAYRAGRLSWRWLALYAAIWLAVFVGLRVALGTPASRFTVAYVWAWNLERLPGGLVYLIVCVGGLLFAAVAGWRHAPPFVRALWPLVVAYVGAIAVFGVWGEVRLWLPVLPIVVAMGLGAIRPNPAE